MYDARRVGIHALVYRIDDGGDVTYRVLAGGPSRDPSAPHAQAWAECLARQACDGVEVVPYVVEADGRGYRAGDVHQWSATAIERVARAREAMIAHAVDLGVDHVWMVDDDVLCGPAVLKSLLVTARQSKIAVGVYWTAGWLPTQPEVELPQVWDQHPYSISQKMSEMLRSGDSCDVAGGGACTLIPTSRAQQGPLYWPPIKGLAHWGEDRWASIRWAERGVPIRAVGGLPIHHAYDTASRTDDAVAVAMSRLWEAS